MEGRHGGSRVVEPSLHDMRTAITRPHTPGPAPPHQLPPPLHSSHPPPQVAPYYQDVMGRDKKAFWQRKASAVKAHMLLFAHLERMGDDVPAILQVRGPPVGAPTVCPSPQGGFRACRGGCLRRSLLRPAR